MLCPACHTENLDDALNCSSCSSSLNLGLGKDPSPGFHGSLDAPTFTPASQMRSGSVRPASGYRSAAAAGIARSGETAPPDFGSRYRVEGLLGEGGMGSVFKAFDLELGRTVALKVIRPELMANTEILQRFKQELLLASRISHKNVLRIHDLGEGVGVKFISMAYIEGRNLAEVLHERKLLPVDEAVTVAKQICQALAAAHEEGVVHRDLKPQNILIDEHECVYVSDFGLAKSLEYDAMAATAMTSAGQVLGTPRYMSPEQVECGPIDGRTDIYSFGLMLYEMVTGDLPFQGNSLQLMLGRVQSVPRNPSLLNSKLPPYLAGIIMRCLEKDPQRRYSTFSEILDDLTSGQFTAPGKKKAPTVWEAHRAKIIVGAATTALLIGGIPLTRHYLPIIRGTRIELGSAAGQMTGKHLAVVPFRVVGTEPQLKVVSLGVTEALNARLFQAKGLTVVSESAASAPSINPADAPEKLGHELGANLLLQGSVQGNAEKIRIDLSLWDADKGITWTREVSGMTQDLLTLEDEICNDVLKGLKLSPDSNAPLNHPTENAQAYDAYLQAQTTMRAQPDPEHVQLAINLYNKAIKTDPGFALAYAGLADADVAMFQKKKDSSWANQAVADARKAAELNAQLPEVHLSLGSAYSVIGRNAESVDELKKAIELLPESDEGYRRLGAAYAAAGKSTDAIESYKKAVAINPYYWPNYNRLGIAYYASGDFENAIAALSKVVEIEPENGFGYGNLGNALLAAGKFQEAVPTLQRALQIAPTAARNSNLGTAYYYLQQYDLAITLFEKAVQSAPTSWLYVSNLADAYRMAGKKEAAAGTYDKAIALAKKELLVNPRSAATMGGLGLCYAKKGDLDQGRKLIEGARTIDPANVDLMYFQAQAGTLAGDPSVALTALQEAFKKGLRPAFALAEPDLRSLRSDPRFQRLVREFSHS